jgi:DNA-directed RNA polymerase subunit RPC12/RpoP
MALKFYETQPVHCPHCGKGVSVTLEQTSLLKTQTQQATRYRCHACEKEVLTWLPGLIVRTTSLGAER